MGSDNRSGVEASVVVPTKNRAHFLKTTLADVMNQVGVDAEVIIIDDGSDPDDAAAYRQLESDRVRVFRLEQSRGPGGARNVGIQAAQGEWLAFLDDDDWWAPHKLRSQIDAAKAVGARWAWCGACCLDDAGEVLMVQAAPTPEEVAHALPSGNVIPAGASNVVAARELVLQIGGFDDRFFHLDDWDCWLRLSQQDPGVAVDEPNVAYFQRINTHSSMRTGALMSELELIDARSRRADRLASRSARLGLLHWMAWGLLSADERWLAARVWLRRATECRRPKDLVRAIASLGGIRAMTTLERAVGGPGRWGHEKRVRADRPAWLDDHRTLSPFP